MVRLNRAVAMAQGPGRGQACSTAWRSGSATTTASMPCGAHLAELAGGTPTALAELRRAAVGATNLRGANHLTTRAARLAGGGRWAPASSCATARNEDGKQPARRELDLRR